MFSLILQTEIIHVSAGKMLTAHNKPHYKNLNCFFKSEHKLDVIDFFFFIHILLLKHLSYKVRYGNIMTCF